VMNLLKMLNKAGIVRARRGAHGGYQLAADPAQVRVLDIIQAVEGRVRITPCCHDLDVDPHNGTDSAAAADDAAADHSGENGTDSACRVRPNCPIMLPIRRLNQRVVDMLEGLTLAELLAGSPGESDGTPPPSPPQAGSAADTPG